jgi:hypothetical protein
LPHPFAPRSRCQRAARQVGGVNTDPEQRAGHRLRGIEQVVECAGQVLPGHRGDGRVVVQCLQQAAPDQFLEEGGSGAVGAFDCEVHVIKPPVLDQTGQRVGPAYVSM